MGLCVYYFRRVCMIVFFGGFVFVRDYVVLYDFLE